MKVRVYTIEWREQIGESHKRIAAFDNYGAARAKAIELLKKRTDGAYVHEHQELHYVDKNGMVYDRLRVKSRKHWYQVTIKYHAAPPAYNATKFW